MLVPPLLHVEGIELQTANALLVAWRHKMGPCQRPMGRVVAHALFHHGVPVALTIAADLIRETCAGYTRAEAIELARLCAAREHLCRPMLRLWREFVLPDLQRAGGYSVAVSYADQALHSGNVYRFDGWEAVAESRSGTDQRSGRRGRRKTIWQWPRRPVSGDGAAA